jgi:hypothetical protein
VRRAQRDLHQPCDRCCSADAPRSSQKGVLVLHGEDGSQEPEVAVPDGQILAIDFETLSAFFGVMVHRCAQLSSLLSALRPSHRPCPAFSRRRRCRRHRRC